VARAAGFPCEKLNSPQIVSRGFAGSTIGNDFKRHFLTLGQSAHAGAFDRTDMNENVLVAVLRLNKTTSRYLSS
jgi:hypothetical protein